MTTMTCFKAYDSRRRLETVLDNGTRIKSGMRKSH